MTPEQQCLLLKWAHYAAYDHITSYRNVRYVKALHTIIHNTIGCGVAGTRITTDEWLAGAQRTGLNVALTAWNRAHWSVVRTFLVRRHLVLAGLEDQWTYSPNTELLVKAGIVENPHIGISHDEREALRHACLDFQHMQTLYGPWETDRDREGYRLGRPPKSSGTGGTRV